MKKQSAITLIALIITIIILLILATVSISLIINNGMLDKAKNAVNTYSESELEEKIKLAFSEAQMMQYTGENNSAENSLKEIFENIYGKDNVIVSKAGKNYKVKVNNSKTAYRIRPDGSYDQYEEMDPTSVYARLDDEGTLYLRATKIDDRYKIYTNSDSIQSNWNTAGNANRNSVLKVIIEEPIAPISFSSFFYYYTNLLEIKNMQNIHTENSTSMSSMFCDCKKLSGIDVSRWDTGNVTSMNNIFSRCYVVNKLDVGGFDTSNVTDMGYMFNNCNKISEIDVSNFNTSKVTNMTNMFFRCFELINLDVSSFDTSNVTGMSNMFCDCYKLSELDLSNFNTKKVTNMSWMFSHCRVAKKLNVKSFDTSNVTDMSYMFNNCNQITELCLEKFDTSKVTNMSYMFYYQSSLKKLELSSKFVINENTNLNEMFSLFSGKKIKTIQDTANKLKAKFNGFTDENFEIIE